MFRCLLEDAESVIGNAVRILSTSRNPTQEAMTKGLFRDDLYGLLSGMRLVLPPVREGERPDILVGALTSELAYRPIDFNKEAQTAINNYDWPGNVRELCNVLRQALLLGDGKRTSKLDLEMTCHRYFIHPGPEPFGLIRRLAQAEQLTDARILQVAKRGCRLR